MGVTGVMKEKKIQEESKLDEVELKKIKKMLFRLSSDGYKDSDKVSFEFVVGSLFPHVLNNIKAETRRQYTLGYVEGMKSKKEKKKF